MKKILFLLLFPLLGTGGLFAAVTVTPLSVDYSTQKVTFSVSWTDEPANGRVWVWVDFCSINGTSPGTYAKAEISGAAATAGSITTVSGNTRGFYVTANPSTVTATLSNAAGNFNWCVYGSDAPPNMTSSNGTYTLYGTPPFTLIAAGGTATQTVAETTIATSNVSITPVTLTDETGCPGIFCIYTGSDLVIDTDHLCQQRATGAQNWEAWIKDSRDDKYYRIVYMPDNNWWLAQSVKYAATGVGELISGYSEDDAGRYYTYANIQASYADGSSGSTGNVQGICPPGWLLPKRTDLDRMCNAIGTTATCCERLRSANSTCPSKPDYYGWANKKAVYNGTVTNGPCGWYGNDSSREDALIIDIHPAGTAVSCGTKFTDAGTNHGIGSVRCFRQL